MYVKSITVKCPICEIELATLSIESNNLDLQQKGVQRLEKVAGSLRAAHIRKYHRQPKERYASG